MGVQKFRVAAVTTAVVASVAGGVLAFAPSSHAADPAAGTAGEAAVARAVPECRASDLTATYRGTDAGMSHVYGKIVLTNTSDEPCSIQGYGGLSYVGDRNGTQIGAAADRTPSRTPKTVLQPGDKVRSAVAETTTGPYPKAKCRPTPVDGFRVYVPDETKALFVPHATTGCANPEVHLLAHKAYR